MALLVLPASLFSLEHCTLVAQRPALRKLELGPLAVYHLHKCGAPKLALWMFRCIPFALLSRGVWSWINGIPMS